MYSMNYIGKFISNFRDFYNEINAATLTGAIDVVVVEQPDGSYTCSPFHVRFGKLGVLRSREKVVDIEINGEPLDIHMKLGESGEAFFVEEVSPSELGDDDYIPPHLACSPIPHDSYLQNFHAQSTSRATLTEITDDNKGIKERGSREGSMESDLLSSQDVSRESSILKDDTALGNNSTAKTFTPETVTSEEDRSRHMSVTVADFRPIETTELAEVQNTCSDAVSIRKDLFKENTEDGLKQPSSGNKRKRRRKSLLKKKGNSQKKNGNGSYCTHIEPLESGEAKVVSGDVKKPLLEKQDQEIIFQIEDLSEKPEDSQDIYKKERSMHGLAILGLGTASSEPCLHPETARELSRMQHASTESDFHFFSDTEVTPGCSQNSRPPSPVQSDTEYEINRQSKIVGEEDEPEKSTLTIQQSWRWGELPSPPKRTLIPSQQSRNSISKLETNEPEPISSSDEETTKKQEEAAAAAAEAEAHRSMLSGMFSFMKKTKRIRHNPESEGIYLSDLNSEELDPEVAALYFPTSYRQGSGGHVAPRSSGVAARDEDAESGNGTSLPQSPHSVEGAIGGPKSLDSDFEEPKYSMFEMKSYGEISMSLCGGLTGPDSPAPSEDSFLQNMVTYDDLVRNPKLVENPDLVVRFNGKYYNWRTACPIIMSLVIYQKPLPQEMVETLSTEYMSKDGQKKAVGEQEATGRGYSWWYWRRTSEPKKLSSAAAPASDSASSPECEKLAEVKEVETKIEKKNECVSEESGPMEKNVDIPVRPTGFDGNIIQEHDDLAIATQTSFPSSPDDQKEDAKEEGYSGSNSSDESDGGRRKSQSIKIPIQRRSYYEHTEKYRKTLRLSSDQIASLNLKDGANEVVFSVTTAYQGTSRCKCHIYKWRFDDRIVISDIDGTITKSDVLGHILPIVGKDWAQSGVAQLFTKIKNNGYKLLYLSARAIGQARVTRDYLRSIKQGDLSLPDGPLLLNPTSLISAFHREVIEKKPEEFKISCLRDIQALFPTNSKPFYAGYGNKINDVWAYRAVGIPIFRIFTINHRGELKHELTQTFQSSYSNMSSIVDQIFPLPPEDTSEDFSNFNYWRDPIPEIEIDPQLIRSEMAPVSGGEKRKSIKGSP